MGRDPRYDILFEPVRIGPKTMRNRFYKAPHCTALGVDRPGATAYFRGMAAEGGWALINTEYCSIHPECDDTPHISARIWDDGDVRNLALMCDRIHEHGALAGIQFWYGSAHALNWETRLPARGVSQIPSDYVPLQSCTEMSKAEIRELQGFFVAAARRARSAGFDVLNLYIGHTHSITHQFLEPFYNRRTDEYGGSFENRSRFWREIAEMVRAEVGDELAISCRLGIDTLRDDAGGMRAAEDGAQFVEAHDHLVDLWDFVIGNLEWGEDASPSRFLPQNHEKPWVDIVRPYATKPVVGVGRFTSPDVMVDVIRSGQLDIIGAARPSIADPFLPKKIEEGRLDDLRECIGCNVCVSRWAGGAARLICTQNATAGEEYRRGWHPERFRPAANRQRDVLVVGAGPAGMECARVLGERGMVRVHLVDAAADPGGHVRWTSRLPGMGQWARVIDYRKIQIDKLRNVEWIPKTRLSAEAIADYGADIVVLATGSTWVGDGLTGITHRPLPGADASLPHCLTPEQVMVEGKRPPGDDVVVYDCDGYCMGVALAEQLATEGRRVTLVTPMAQVAPYMELTLELPRMKRRLHELGVRVLKEQMLTSIEPGVAMAADIYSPDRTEALAADGVVLCTMRRSDDALYHALTASPEIAADAGISAVYRIGDCVAPRILADIVFDGHRLAREIDAPDPASPRPEVREYRVLGRSDAEYDAIVAEGGDLAVSSIVDPATVG